MNITVTADELKLIRRTLVKAASTEWLHRTEPARSHECKQLDQLLDRLPEPLDELELGVDEPDVHRFPDPHEAAALLDEWHAEKAGR